MKKYSKKYKYGSIIELKGNRTEPFGARITLGYNSNGYPVYHFLGVFSDELDAHLCLREYNNKPFDIYIDEEKYKKIIKFVKLPSKVLIETEDSKIDRSKYTFAQVFKEWSRIYFPTKEEIEREKLTHEKTRGKLSKSNRGNLMAAFNNSKDLHDKIYVSLRKIDFESQINKTRGKRSKLYNMQNLYKKMDEYASEKDIIKKSYAQYIKIYISNEEANRTPYNYNEIEFLWTFNGDTYIDILLCLLYSCMRIEELLELEIKNVNLKEKYFIAGSKTESGKNRIIPIHHKIFHIVYNYYNTNRKNKFLFTDKNGNKIEYQAYYQYFCKFKEHNQQYFNKEHVIHETRHTSRSEMDRHGANKKCMDLIMGHKSKDVGERVYNHKTIEELKETIELISYEKTEILQFKMAK